MPGLVQQVCQADRAEPRASQAQPNQAQFSLAQLSLANPSRLAHSNSGEPSLYQPS